MIRESGLTRVKLTLAYEGTRYAGWQMQAPHPAHPPLITVQGELERALARIVGRRVVVHGAGRTDAGVHAEGQVCHIDLPDDRLHIDWQRALNVTLPHDIRVLKVEEAPPDFHARKSAARKRYGYTLWMHRERAVPRLQAFAWSIPPIDCDLLLAACPLIMGCRDFAGFQNSGTLQSSTVRTLHSLSFRPHCAGLLTCPAHWPVATLEFEGDGFLKQMVRNMVGLLVWVGQKKITLEAVPHIVAAKNRRALPSPSAPPQGLTLLEVMY